MTILDFFISRAEKTGRCNEVAIVAAVIGGSTVFEGQRSVEVDDYIFSYLRASIY